MNKVFKVLAAASIMAMAVVPMAASAQNITAAPAHTGKGQSVNQVKTVPAVWGPITNYTNDKNGTFITVKGRGLAINDQSEMVLAITKDTKIIDAKGNKWTLQSVIDNKKVVKAFYGPNITKSLPARGTALTLVVQDRSFTGIEGAVSVASEGRITVTGFNMYTSNEETIVLRIADNALIYDHNGQTITAKDIKPGMTVKALYGPETTKSIPPQSTSKYIVVNTEADVQAAPGTDGIVTDKADGKITVIGYPLKQGGVDFVILTVDDQTEIVDEQGLPLTADALKQGGRVEAYYGEIMTMIYPAQTHADKLVVKKEETIKLEGTIEAKESTADDQVYVNVGSDDNTDNDVVLNISEATKIIYSLGIDTGLKPGSKIIAFHSPAMTMSLPPQTHAMVILVNNDEIAAE